MWSMCTGHRKIAALCAAIFPLALIALAPAVAAESPPLPAGTSKHADIPEYRPLSRGDAGTLAWCKAMEAWADTHSTRPEALDAAFAAAWARRWRLREHGLGPRFTDLARRFGGDAYAGAAWLEAARAYMSLHEAGHRDVVRARSAWEDARRGLGRPAPVDADEALESRWAKCSAHVTRWIDETEVDLLEVEGRLPDAARRLEELAEDAAWVAARGKTRSAILSRAARLYALGPSTDLARDAIDRALEVSESEAATANYAYWRLCLDHEQLDDEGAPALGDHWPGEAFESDAHAMLHGLAGNPHAATLPLRLGSHAFKSGHYEAALRFYLLALNDPVLVERARQSETLCGALLVGFTAAMALHRYDDAEKILAAVESIGRLDPKEARGFRAQLELSREGWARQRAREAAEAARAPTPEEESGPRRDATGARLIMPDEDPAFEDRKGSGREGEYEPDTPIWPWAAGAGLALLVLGLARRRRR